MSTPDSNTPRPTLFDAAKAAVQFLTRVPLPPSRCDSADFHAAALRRGVLFFPVVGGLIGVGTALIFLAGLRLGLPPVVAALLALGFEAAFTGAFHEDAFADTWDALGGGWTREQVLQIMKDSRLGVYGVLALVIGVGIRAAAITATGAMEERWSAASIVAAAALARIAIVGMMATTSPIPDRPSRANDVSGTQSWRTVVIAAAISAAFWLPWAILSPWRALASLLAAVGVLIWFRRKILQQVGGTTGDLLGCSAYLTQLVVLIGSSAVR